MFPIWCLFPPYVSHDCAVNFSQFGLKHLSQGVRSGRVLEFLHSSASESVDCFFPLLNSFLTEKFFINTVKVLY